MLDACVVINLDATGRMAEILAAIPNRVAIADRVLIETRFDPTIEGPEGGPAERATLLALISQGTISVLSPESEDELNTFVDLTVDLDDGEAMTVALALHRGHTIATDERKAIRMHDGRTPLRSTLDLIKAWADHQQPVPAELRSALTDLRVRGHYLPARSHPLRAWWDTIVDAASL